MGSIEEVVRKEVKDELMEPSTVVKYQEKLAVKGDEDDFEDVLAGNEMRQVTHGAKYVVIKVCCPVLLGYRLCLSLTCK
jgi:hypothetical protein